VGPIVAGVAILAAIAGLLLLRNRKKHADSFPSTTGETSKGGFESALYKTPSNNRKNELYRA